MKFDGLLASRALAKAIESEIKNFCDVTLERTEAVLQLQFGHIVEI